MKKKTVWSKKCVISVVCPFVFSFIEMGLKIKCLSYYSLLDSNIGPQKILTNSLKVGFLNRMIKQSHVNNHLSKNVKFTAAWGKDSTREFFSKQPIYWHRNDQMINSLKGRNIRVYPLLVCWYHTQRLNNII